MRARRAWLAALLSTLAACFDAGPASNSSGRITVTGDETWSSTFKGTGVHQVPQKTGSTCTTRLYDVLSTFGGDSHPGDRNATYTFGLELGRSSTGLSALPMGVQAQGDASKGTTGLTAWPSEVFASFGRYEGFKHTEESVYTVGGSVTITRFDATKLIGTFELSGLRTYCDATGGPCNVQATGDFDITNVDCAP